MRIETIVTYEKGDTVMIELDTQTEKGVITWIGPTVAYVDYGPIQNGETQFNAMVLVSELHTWNDMYMIQAHNLTN